MKFKEEIINGKLHTAKEIKEAFNKATTKMEKCLKEESFCCSEIGCNKCETKNFL